MYAPNVVAWCWHCLLFFYIHFSPKLTNLLKRDSQTISRKPYNPAQKSPTFSDLLPFSPKLTNVLKRAVHFVLSVCLKPRLRKPAVHLKAGGKGVVGVFWLIMAGKIGRLNNTRVVHWASLPVVVRVYACVCVRLCVCVCVCVCVYVLIYACMRA